MSAEPRSALAFAAALALAALLAPVAIRLGHRFGMLDRPSGWKVHQAATPYLGGVSLVLACSVASLALSSDRSELVVPIAIAVGLMAIGIVDDARQLRATPRLIAAAAAGAGLWFTEFGWAPTGHDGIDLALTVVVVVAVINAINLIDLIDGIAATLVLAGAAGAGALALRAGEGSAAVAAFALAGACAGFLPFNLARPARLFLGDGGSMPAGFLLAAVSMHATSDAGTATQILAAPLFVAVPLVDMGYRIASRIQRRVPLLEAGRDSLATGLDDLLRSPVRVCALAALLQGAICAGAVVAVPTGVIPTCVAWVAALAATGLAAYAISGAGSPSGLRIEIVAGCAAAVAVGVILLGLAVSVAEDRQGQPGRVADAVAADLAEVAPDYGLVLAGDPECERLDLPADSVLRETVAQQQICKLPVVTTAGLRAASRAEQLRDLEVSLGDELGSIAAGYALVVAGSADCIEQSTSDARCTIPLNTTAGIKGEGAYQLSVDSSGCWTGSSLASSLGSYLPPHVQGCSGAGGAYLVRTNVDGCWTASGLKSPLGEYLATELTGCIADDVIGSLDGLDG